MKHLKLMIYTSTAVMSPMSAHAYNCINVGSCAASCGEIIGGSTQQFRLESGDFNSAQISQIEAGADMWSAGSGDINRGADWHFTRGSDVTTAAFLNGRPEIFARDQAWWNSHMTDPAAHLATHFAWAACSRSSMDMVLHSEMLAGTATNNYKNQRPSVGLSSDVSLAQNVAHEFGHWFGLDHEDDFISLMNSRDPAGGDIGASFRLNENELVALQDFKGDSSTGSNLLVSKYTMLLPGTLSAQSVEIDLPDWTLARGLCLNSPSVAQALVNIVSLSTSTLTGVAAEWQLSPDDDCQDGDNTVVGSKAGFSVFVGSPGPINADSLCAPSTLATGTYRLCVVVDPADAKSETSETDNVIRFSNSITITN